MHILTKTGFALALAVAGAAAASPGRHGGERSGLGPIKFLACHGPTFNYAGDEVAAGAYNNYCYDASGRPVGLILHGPFRHVLLEGGGQIDVTFLHFDDRNRDGDLSPWEIDGVLRLEFQATPENLSRTFTSPDLTSAAVVLEVPPEDITWASGWFAGTVMGTNRTNLRLDPITVGADGLPVMHPSYNNFSTFGFLSRPIEIRP